LGHANDRPPRKAKNKKAVVWGKKYALPQKTGKSGTGGIVHRAVGRLVQTSLRLEKMQGKNLGGQGKAVAKD